MGFISSDIHGIILSSLIFTHCYNVLAILDKKGWYIEDEPRRNYRLEDFLWSGSGEGEGSGGGSGAGSQTWATTTIFKTTTILTTVYPTPVWVDSCSSGALTGSDCISDIQPSSVPGPTSDSSSPVSTSTPVLAFTETYPSVSPHQPLPDMSYWLITIIRANVSSLDFSTSVFENRLAHLYKTAFQRQQERHLSGKNGEEKRRERREAVWVRVHRVSGVGGTGNEALELVYTVLVGGRPVSAKVAANDMRYVSQQEVVNLLGFPVLTKAEPYLKAPEQASSSPDERQTWLIVWSVITSVILLALLVGLVLLARAKKEKMSNREQLNTEQLNAEQGEENHAFQTDNHQDKDYLEKDDDHDVESNSSVTGIKGEPSIAQKRPTARPRSNKPSSPNSYLSMPSVKAFPTGAPIPGPLERVLEPEPVGAAQLSRHSSESADPGVVGPLVWDLHCHRLNKRDEDCGESERNASVGRMRKRFHELLDDAFSLFGSRSGTPDDEKSSPNHNIYGRAKSALIMPVDSLETVEVLRPKTSAAIRETEKNDDTDIGRVRPLRGAWDLSPVQLTSHPRPLSAGPFHKPKLDPAWLLSDNSLSSADPALPLIKAIKTELDKFPAVSQKTPYKM
ncbi:hypothetical protein O3M35_004282 [Rhynocoris fuscipes]|uniref:Uncharacterized protein n=1 Tax=Rhynocoris fuscipes TaxID=488301 RepID=A0AAW1CL92_9HEMI